MRKYPPRSGNYFYTYANEELLNLKMVELTEMNPSDEISLESQNLLRTMNKFIQPKSEEERNASVCS